jgi:hypothetical protein
MGYDLHITRSSERFHDGGIRPEEWLAILERQQDLALAGVNGPHFAYWLPSGDEEEWLDWHRGTVYSKNPSPGLIARMVDIASLLGAQVLGDDGERYATGGVVLDGDIVLAGRDWRST